MALHVRRSGAGRALLLLHGIGSSAIAWERQFERLGDSFACIAPDLPGYGDSSDLPPPPSLDAMVDAVAALLDETGPAHVAGVSFGALVGLGLLRRRPAQVRSLVLADATLGRARTSAAERESWLAHRYALAGDLQVRADERAREIAPGGTPDAIAAIAGAMRRARPSGYRAVAEIIAATDAVPWLAEIRTPTLVICGEHDTVVGTALSRTIVDGIAGAQLVTIADAGHAPHIEQPDAFARALRTFIDALVPTAQR